MGDSAAVVDATAEVSPPMPAMPAQPQSTLVLQLRDGRWLVETARDTLVYDPSNCRRLKAIEWLVGDWSDEPAAGEAAHFHSSCAWTTNKNFLIRKYSVGGKDHRAATGTEVIGWDPRHHRIQAWNFDSNGGYGESTWKQDGNRWIIQHTGVLQDGSGVSAVHVISRIDDNTASLKSQERMLNGQREPDAKEVVVHRLPPAEAARARGGAAARQDDVAVAVNHFAVEPQMHADCKDALREGWHLFLAPVYFRRRIVESRVQMASRGGTGFAVMPCGGRTSVVGGAPVTFSPLWGPPTSFQHCRKSFLCNNLRLVPQR